MLDIKSMLKSETQNLHFLKETYLIKKKDLRSPKWNWLYKQYQSLQDEKTSVGKTVVTILNSIIYQNKQFFFLTRENIKDLLKADVNWSEPVGFSEHKYKEIISFMVRNGIIAFEAYEGFNSRKPSMYKVISPDILKFINNKNQQKQELEDFIKKSSKSKGLPEFIYKSKVKVDNKWLDCFGLLVSKSYENHPDRYDSIKKLENIIQEMNNKFDLIAEDKKPEVEKDIFKKEKELESLKYKLWYKEYFENENFYKNLEKKEKGGYGKAQEIQ
jgi:hypothetical protein